MSGAPGRLRRALWRPRGWSLRRRLLLLMSALVFVVLLLSVSAHVATIRKPLVNQLDGEIQRIAQTAGADPPPDAQTLLQTTGPGTSMLGDVYIAYIEPDGTIGKEVRLPPSGDEPQLAGLDLNAAVADAARPFSALSANSGDPWRLLLVPRFADGPPAGTLVVASSLDRVNDTMVDATSSAYLASLLVLVLFVIVGRYLIRAVLRPLDRIEKTAASIAGGDLSQRVEQTTHLDTEIGRLAAALNGMLAQIETAFDARAESEQSMRRFLADVGHELRTPLATIRGSTELYRMGAMTEPAEVERAIDRIENDSARLERLVEDLMLLARLDEPGATAGHGGFRLRRTPMDLRTLAVDALHDVRALDPTRDVELTGLDHGSPSTSPVLGDESRLRQVVTNLIGNAITHTPTGTAVQIRVGIRDGHAALEISDDGPGMIADQALRAFERFYRADQSRSRAAGGGAGLGLAIAHSLATAHGGRLELDTAPGRGATFRLLLPVLAEATGDPAR